MNSRQHLCVKSGSQSLLTCVSFVFIDCMKGVESHAIFILENKIQKLQFRIYNHSMFCMFFISVQRNVNVVNLSKYFPATIANGFT